MRSETGNQPNSTYMSKILCIGEALMDMICTDKGKSLSEGSNFLKKTGGAPMNVAAAIAALGGNVMILAIETEYTTGSIECG